VRYIHRVDTGELYQRFGGSRKLVDHPSFQIGGPKFDDCEVFYVQKTEQDIKKEENK
jgi:hypothetical protein